MLALDCSLAPMRLGPVLATFSKLLRQPAFEDANPLCNSEGLLPYPRAVGRALRTCTEAAQGRIWQRRAWEHTIRDDDDVVCHID